MATLKKSDMSSRVAAKIGGSKSEGNAALNAVLDSMQEVLSGGNRLVLTGFGSFEVRQVKARRVRSIHGGGLMTVPGHQRVGFKAGPKLSAAAR